MYILAKKGTKDQRWISWRKNGNGRPANTLHYIPGWRPCLTTLHNLIYLVLQTFPLLIPSCTFGSHFSVKFQEAAEHNAHTPWPKFCPTFWTTKHVETSLHRPFIGWIPHNRGRSLWEKARHWLSSLSCELIPSNSTWWPSSKSRTGPALWVHPDRAWVHSHWWPLFKC